MPGLEPGIHAFDIGRKRWMAGSSPAMTSDGFDLGDGTVRK